MIWTRSCGTAAKAGGNREDKAQPTVMEVPCLLTKISGADFKIAAASEAGGITLGTLEQFPDNALRKPPDPLI